MKKEIPGFVKNPTDIDSYKTNLGTRLIDQHRLKVREIFHSLQGEGSRSGESSIFIRLSYCNKNCWYCFGIKPGRRIPQIVVKNGNNKKLSEIKKGDVLLTFDEEQNIVETTVTNTMNREVKEWYELKINGKIYFVTPEHLFFTKRGPVLTKDLKVEDIIYHIGRGEKLSYLMKNNNPMFNEKSKIKKLKNTDYQEVGRKGGETRKKQNLESPILVFKRNNPEEYKKWVSKQSENLKGENNPHHKMTPETKDKWRKNMIKNNTGKKRTEETKLKLSLCKIGDKNPMKEPKVAYKNFISHQTPMSGYEIKFQQICIENNIDVEFIGDGKLPIGYKYPDFIIKNTNKLIEIYSSTFPYKNGNKYYQRGPDWVENRREHFANYGYEVEFFDMDSTDNEEHCAKLLKYVHNGYLVESTKHIKVDDKRNYKLKKLKVYNISCEPYPTYLIDNMWVHNCDTDWSFGDTMSLEDIKQEISKYNCEWIVWTGGEPTLQLTNKIIKYFKKEGYKQAIETNGTNPVPKGLDYISTAPKGTVKKLNESFPNGVDGEIRYPIGKGKYPPKIEVLPKAKYYYVSPLFMGTEKQRFDLVDENLQWCIEFVKKNPEWRLSVQQHKLWDIR